METKKETAKGKRKSYAKKLAVNASFSDLVAISVSNHSKGGNFKSDSKAKEQ